MAPPEALDLHSLPVEGENPTSALLQSHCLSVCSFGFADNTDLAEKGKQLDGKLPAKMKRSLYRKTSSNLLAQCEEGSDIAHTSSIGATRHVGGDIAIEALTQLETEDSSTSPSPSSSNANTPSTEKSPEDELKKTETKEEADQRKEREFKRHCGRIRNQDFANRPNGFPRLAAFQNSSSSVRMFRRFGEEHARLLLHLQVEITNIKKELNELDDKDSKPGGCGQRLKAANWGEKWDAAQVNLLERLRVKLLQYDELLLKDSSLRALFAPPARDYNNLLNFVWSKKPLCAGEYDFVFYDSDFVFPSTSRKNEFDGFIESCLARWPRSFLFKRLLGQKNQVHAVGDEGIQAFSVHKIALGAKWLSVCVAVTILLIPVFLLFLTRTSSAETVVMVLLFVLAFASIMSLAGASVVSLFIGTCTYCAVLVTFLGNIRSGNSAGAG
ncbi:hypothetical protein BJ875DRAFT_522616 [Amylocarpus encephaloides]|uniref:DUF6594 domain-containing protein n=1 Tax=Amylocarpus encephaloides TaxID=45428 RepID=A0A9P7Y9Y5_9HELO|nr:hypothetical protein BJ875DRAFT_522616 [Amylocarpus encephaloides]